MRRRETRFSRWVALARASVRLDDVPAATVMLGEASRVLKLTPDAIVLGEWIAETAESIELVSSSAIRDLTPAELHILQYLPTHLSFPQIAGQVFVSPNTVKTQAQSVYRKLGVTSRREAVAYVSRPRSTNSLERSDQLTPQKRLRARRDRTTQQRPSRL